MLRLCLIAMVLAAQPLPSRLTEHLIPKHERVLARECDTMANPVWHGVTNNWDTGTNWNTGSKPGVADNVLFDGTSQVSATVGVSGESAVTVSYLQTLPAYRGDLGSPTDPLTIGTSSSGVILHRGSGRLSLNAAAATAFVVIDSPNMQEAAWLTGGTSYTVAKRGHVIVATCDNLLVTGVHASVETLATATVGSGAATRLILDQGYLLNRATPYSGSIIQIAGGMFRQEGADLDLCSIYMTGGTFQYAATESPGTAITLLYAMAGTLDLSELTHDTSITTVVYGPDLEVIESPVATIGATTFLDLRKEVP